MLSSNLDNHNYQPGKSQMKGFEMDGGVKQGPQTREPTQYYTSSQSGLATAGPFFEAHNVATLKKQQDLASNLINGAATERYTTKDSEGL